MDEKHLGKLENGRHNPNSYNLFKLVKVLDPSGDLFKEIMKEVKS